MKFTSPDNALAAVSSGNRVYIHGGAAVPGHLVAALTRRALELHDVEVVHLHTEGPAPYAAPELAANVRHNALFIGTNVRAAVAAGRADYTPVFLSDIPRLFAPGGPLPLDVALIQVTPPDAHGNCSLGVSVDCALAAVREAHLVIAQVNPNLPRSRGVVVPESDIDLAVDADDPLPEIPPATISDDARNIARIVAGLVSDGATLQLGIGAIPAAVCSELRGHTHLGVHTEMFTDTVLPLIESGVIDGSQKTRDTGIVVSSFVLGSDSLYRFIDNNPAVELHPVSYTNDVNVIASQRRMVAINSALSVDLTGQVAADSIGPRFYSGIGGQVDFIRGAARSDGGMPIIALPSTAGDGSISRIVAQLEAGSGVVTTRGDVHWVVTEYGAANLFGQSIRTRVRMLIELAHPRFREQLEAEAGGLGYLGRSF